jgi:UDP-N-acetyl-D-mannosaminuronic acid transferase (WecB/TagA/CpsF family)
MKTKEEIRREAEEMFWKRNGRDFEEHEITQIEKGEYMGGYLGGYTQCQEDLNKDLYSEIENLIITWSNDGTKTAGTLTRQIMEKINNY